MRTPCTLSVLLRRLPGRPDLHQVVVGGGQCQLLQLRDGGEQRLRADFGRLGGAQQARGDRRILVLEGLGSREVQLGDVVGLGGGLQGRALLPPAQPRPLRPGVPRRWLWGSRGE